MAVFSKCAALLVAASVAVAAPFESLAQAPEGWTLDHAAPESQPISLKIALKQGNAAGFEKMVMDMSTPGHPTYGKHFKSYNEMKQHLLPSREAINSVTAWLKGHKADAEQFEMHVDADWITVKTTVGTANKMLDTNFNWYKGDSRRTLRTLEYSVPESIASHIQMIQPTTRFNSNNARGATVRTMTQRLDEGRFDAEAAGCGGGSIKPDCLKSLYKIDYTPKKDSGVKLAFASFLEQYAKYRDLSLFQKNVYPAIAGQNFSVELVNGGKNDQGNSGDAGEANLDLQYMMSMAGPLPITEYSVGGRGPLIPDDDQQGPDISNEPYSEFLNYLLKLDAKALPSVLSISYGENEQEIPFNYATSVCNMFSQLASRGVSVLISSGDSGPGGACKSNVEKGKVIFTPNFPAACPFITSVGSTQGTSGTESAASFSSGGFSNYWGQPEYQSKAIASFLSANGDSNTKYFNKTGRAFPDISSQGVNYAVYTGGFLQGESGTSASAPMFAGLIGLLNDARVQAGKPVLGFLNPWLYQNADALNDVTNGASSGCSGAVPGGAKWKAVAGWDPATGLGTPNFPALMKAAMGATGGNATHA